MLAELNRSWRIYVRSNLREARGSLGLWKNGEMLKEGIGPSWAHECWEIGKDRKLDFKSDWSIGEGLKADCSIHR